MVRAAREDELDRAVHGGPDLILGQPERDVLRRVEDEGPDSELAAPPGELFGLLATSNGSGPRWKISTSFSVARSVNPRFLPPAPRVSEGPDRDRPGENELPD